MAPINLGGMGYYGATAMYVPSAVQGQGYEAEGLHLDFYRDYNASRENPGLSKVDHQTAGSPGRALVIGM